MKKLLSFALSIALLLALFACGKPAAIPNPPLVLGEKFLNDLDYEQALLQFDQAIAIEPKNPRGYLGKADALLHLNRQVDAIQALTDGAKVTSGETRTALQGASAEVEKSSVDGYIALSSAYEKLGWREIALALLQRVCEELPGESSLKIALEGLIGTAEPAQEEVQTTNLGNRTERRDYGNGYYEIHKYNEQGYCFRVDCYDENGETWYFLYEKNEQGQTVLRNDYDANGKKTGFRAYQYNERGEEVREDIYDADGTLLSYCVVHGNERKDYYPDGTPMN